jgi:AP endonuclease-2
MKNVVDRSISKVRLGATLLSMAESGLKIVSWNVNGLRTLGAWRPTTAKGPVLAGVLNELDTDIVCFQETKLTRKQQCLELAEEADPNVWVAFFSLCEAKQGYSGTATFCKRTKATPIAWWDSLEGLQSANGNGVHLDREGRSVITDHGEFILINVYCPNAASGQRLAAQLDFLLALEQMCKRLIIGEGRQVIIAGDLNVSLHPIDHCDIKRSIVNHSDLLREWAKDPICMNSKTSLSFPLIQKSYEKLESGDKMEFEDFPCRQWLLNLLENSDGREEVALFIDSFRTTHPTEEGAFTCWNMRVNGREGNYGTRIDYILLSTPKLSSCLKDCSHLRSFKGSDHCPVTCLLAVEIVNSPDIPADSTTALLLKEKGTQKKLSSFFSSGNRVTDAPSQQVQTSNQQTSKKASLVRKTPSSTLSSSTKPQKISKKSSKPPSGAGLERFGFIKKSASASTTSATETLSQEKPSEDEEMSLSQTQPTSTQEDTMIVDELRQLTHEPSSSAVSDDTIPRSQSEELLGWSAPALSSSWKSLLHGSPQVPLCKHQEKSELRTVTKKGVNQGREFYVCKYPTHVHRSKSSSSQEIKESCGFFQWVKNKTSKNT